MAASGETPMTYIIAVLAARSRIRHTLAWNGRSRVRNLTATTVAHNLTIARRFVKEEVFRSKEVPTIAASWPSRRLRRKQNRPDGALLLSSVVRLAPRGTLTPQSIWKQINGRTVSNGCLCTRGDGHRSVSGTRSGNGWRSACSAR